MDKKIILAPMAGLSDQPFRRLCRSFGADLAVSEMISAKGLLYGDHKSRELLIPGLSDQPHWVQLFGSDPEIIRAAAELAIDAGADLIDINMGCPVRKVIKTGAGAALLLAPDKAEAIMRALNRPPAIPYTVKVRSGWDSRGINLDLFIELAAKHGARALTCHPRTAVMMFSGLADWQLLLKAAKKSPLPIIGSGDLFEPETAIAALQQNNLSGIMLGRGTLGRPWLFREIKETLKNNPLAKPGAEEKRLTILTHSRLLQEVYGERTGLLLYRKHLAWYSRGICGAAAFRKELFSLTSMTELNQKVESLFI